MFTVNLLDESQVCSCSLGIIHRFAFFTQEEPQVVDEVAVPRLPTGEDEAQLPGVSAARCRC